MKQDLKTRIENFSPYKNQSEIAEIFEVLQYLNMSDPVSREILELARKKKII